MKFYHKASYATKMSWQCLGCSKAKATEILKKVKSTVTGKWYVPYSDAVPTQPFLDFMGWDEDKIHSLAMKEAAIKAAVNPKAL